ncbi:MAG: UDP-2,3-diacylglucosamine diphosphatase LpxI [Armatimonadetes bacterium]|nr:UDP-2,3-diacylglucosamine diphosphatase LpxI [Armatimonadota bacterium]
MVRADGAGTDAGTGAVGLLAGDGRLPELLAQAARLGGRPVICVQMAGASPVLESLAEVFVRLEPGDWEGLFQVWRAHGVREVLLAGRFGRADLPARLQGGGEAARTFLARQPDRRDQRFLEAFAAMLGGMGMRVIDQRTYAGNLLPEPGRLAGPPLSAEEERDVALGMGVARTLAEQDVGQTLILKSGVILAVEAAEGTDAAIRRGGEMAAGAVVVKVSRPRQDPRFDVPTIGPETVETMAAVRARALAVEAGRTIVLDRRAVAAAAEKAGITVVAVDAPPLPGVP